MGHYSSDSCSFVGIYSGLFQCFMGLLLKVLRESLGHIVITVEIHFLSRGA